STTAPWPGVPWLVPDPSPSPWTVTTPGKQGAPWGWGPAEPRVPTLPGLMGSVSSGAIQPTWVPFGSTVAHRRRLRFALDVYDSTWSSRLHQPTYSLGELINIEASVSTGPHLPLRVFVDECVASPSTAAWLEYKVIADNG
ncbi:ZP3 protein, partial [Circaetus pectoralis]|nr:ZP3 protein [Circaetus pectoralis]